MCLTAHIVPALQSRTQFERLCSSSSSWSFLSSCSSSSFGSLESDGSSPSSEPTVWCTKADDTTGNAHNAHLCVYVCVCVYLNHLFDLPVRTPSGQRADSRNGEQVHPLRYHLNPPTDIALSPPHKEVTIATTPNPRYWLHPPAAVPVLGSWVKDAFNHWFYSTFSMWFYCEGNRKCCFHASPGLLILCMPAVMLHLHPLFLQQVHQRPAPPTKPLPPDPALTPPPQVKCAEVCVLCVPLYLSGLASSEVQFFLGSDSGISSVRIRLNSCHLCFWCVNVAPRWH